MGSDGPLLLESQRIFLDSALQRRPEKNKTLTELCSIVIIQPLCTTPVPCQIRESQLLIPVCIYSPIKCNDSTRLDCLVSAVNLSFIVDQLIRSKTGERNLQLLSWWSELTSHEMRCEIFLQHQWFESQLEVLMFSEHKKKKP